MIDGMRRRAARATALLLLAAGFGGTPGLGAERPAGTPLPITIRAPEARAPEQRAPEPPAPKSRLEHLLAKREEAARRWQIGICRGCSRADQAEPAGRMIEVSTARPRASWETAAPP